MFYQIPKLNFNLNFIKIVIIANYYTIGLAAANNNPVPFDGYVKEFERRVSIPIKDTFRDEAVDLANIQSQEKREKIIEINNSLQKINTSIKGFWSAIDYDKKDETTLTQEVREINLKNSAEITGKDQKTLATKDEQYKIIFERRKGFKKNIEILKNKAKDLNLDKKTLLTMQATIRAHNNQLETFDKHYKPFFSEVLARKLNPWMYQVNLPYAHELQNYNGAQSHLGIMDNGKFEKNHWQFRDRKQERRVQCNHDIQDIFGHQTKVALIASGQLVLTKDSVFQGVSNNSNLSIINYNKIDGSMEDIARSNVSVINMSFGRIDSLSKYSERQLENLIQSEKLIVTAAGNDNTSVLPWPSRYAQEDWTRGQIIVVGAVEPDNTLSNYSNWPSNEKIARYFVVAPGNVQVVDASGDNHSPSGTSFAAPMVSGQAVLIKDRWPYLSAANLAQIIFKTATPLGSRIVTPKEPDMTYGWGLINIRKSLQPIGVLKIIKSDGSFITMDKATLKENIQGAMHSALFQGAKRGDFQSYVLDDFNRYYIADLGKNVKSPRDKMFTNWLNTLDHSASNSQTKTEQLTFGPHGSYLSWSTRQPATNMQMVRPIGLFAALNTNFHANQNLDKASSVSFLNKISMLKRFADGSEIVMSFGGDSNYFGLDNYSFGKSSTNNLPSITESVTNNAYSQLVQAASSFAFGREFNYGKSGDNNFDVDSKIKIKFGWSGAYLNNMHAMHGVFARQPKHINKFFTQTEESLNEHQSLTSIELSKVSNRNMIGLSFGHLVEEKAILGTTSFSNSDAFNLNKKGKTNIVTLNLAQKLSPEAFVAGYISHGVTSGYQNNNSLISKVSAVYSNAYGIGLVLKDSWRSRDNLSFSLSSPLNISSGNMSLNLATGVNRSTGELIYGKREINLTSPAREYRSEINYMMPTSKNAQLNLRLGYRHNAGNIAGEKEHGIALSWHLSF